MKSRSFAYNPSRILISGTTQIGDLAVGLEQQRYSDNLTWWIGADEDLGFVICSTVPEGNQPTPIGNVGTVKFWRTAFTENDFLNLTNGIYKTSFVSGQNAKDWLSENGYWTSWAYNPNIGSPFKNGFWIDNAAWSDFDVWVD